MKKLVIALLIVALGVMFNVANAAASPQDWGYYLRLQDRVLPEGDNNRWSIWAIGPDGVARETALYELAGLCHNQGGYYYIGSDGYWHWNYCE